MKLTIDIPEQIYLNAKADLLCGGDVIVKAIKNGTPHETVTEFADRCRECGREKVLDKIRGDIEQIAKDYDKFADYRRVHGLWIALDIIDKYRAETEQVGNPDRLEGGE